MPALRLRTRPKPTATSVVGEGRDLDALASIAWAGVLSTTQVQRLHFPTRRRTQRRLRALLDHGFVRAHLQGEALHRENVYTATARGIDWLAERGTFPAAVPKPGTTPRLQKLAHTLAVRDVFVAFVLAERAGHFTLEDFRFEGDLVREPVFKAAHLIPDALASIARGTNGRHVGLELDRGTESLSVLRTKFAAWRTVLGSGGDRRAFATATLLLVALRPRRRATLDALAAEIGLGPRVRTVLLAEVGSILAAGWPHGPAAPPGRAARPTHPENASDFQMVGDEDAAAFRPIG